MRSRRKIIVALVIAALMVVVAAAHIHLWWHASAARFQHTEELGRSIPLSWHKNSPTTISVPSSATYHVNTVEPYYYELKLKTGYSFPASAPARSQGMTIGYFVASPSYPWWYVVDIFGLKEAEVLALDEQYSVKPHPKSWLNAQPLGF
jgi:hypothetical protein